MSDETVGDVANYGGYEVKGINVDRSPDNEIERIRVSLKNAQSRRDAQFTFKLDEGDTFVSNVEGIRGNEILYIGQAAATAEDAVSGVPDVENVTPYMDKVIENIPNRDD